MIMILVIIWLGVWHVGWTFKVWYPSVRSLKNDGILMSDSCSFHDPIQWKRLIGRTWKDWNDDGEKEEEDKYEGTEE